MPNDLKEGIHSITVETLNQWGEEFYSSQIFEIK
jgi:hypothetical protein